jgi:hypothetical protein
MGNKLFWAAPPADSSWTDSKIYSATAQAGPFNLLATVSLGSLSSPETSYNDEAGTATTWYEVSFFNSGDSVETAPCAPFQVASVTTTYTTPGLVAGLMQVRNSQNFAGFDAQTYPTVQDVIDAIHAAEDRIDYDTGHAWRARFSQSPSGQDTASSQFETYNQSDLSYVSEGIRVNLRHRSVRDLDATEGDVLQVWNGNSWFDVLANMTEGRGSDYWLDNEKGTLWVLNFIGSNFGDSIRIKYRYGEQSVPGDIQRAATLMVACELATGDDRSYLLAQGGNGMVLDAKVAYWERSWREIVRNHAEIRVYGG